MIDIYPLSWEDLKKKLEKSRNTEIGQREYNNLVFDPFHLQVHNCNPYNIQLITEDIIDYYIQTPLCWSCSIEDGPRPSLCNNQFECRFWTHKLSKTEGHICIECRKKRNEIKSIELGRHNLAWLWYNKIGFIFRSTRSNRTILHHINCDRYDDTPGNHCLLETGFHTKYHQKIENIKKQFLNYDITTQQEEIESLNKYYTDLLKVDNDISIMKMIRDIQIDINKQS